MASPPSVSPTTLNLINSEAKEVTLTVDLFVGKNSPASLRTFYIVAKHPKAGLLVELKPGGVALQKKVGTGSFAAYSWPAFTAEQGDQYNFNYLYANKTVVESGEESSDVYVQGTITFLVRNRDYTAVQGSFTAEFSTQYSFTAA